METIRSFSKLWRTDANIAGGKGASLGEMTQAGIPVPPGFVALAPAFEQFLKETDLDVEIDSILHTVNHQEMHTVEHASEKIQKLILDAKMPEDIAQEIRKEFEKLDAKYVAVRSSATAEDSSSAAWAGQLESYLNTTGKTLLENVQKCWASLFTPRAIFYRFEKGLHDQKISVAVVVQKMVNSEKSGIAFSVHPVTEDPNQLIIEAGFGLGEAIVSGQVTPDSYVVEKREDTFGFEEADKFPVAYERHQRDYTVLGTSVVFKTYFKKEVIDYFGHTPAPMFIVVENDVLYHFITNKDSENRALRWSEKYGIEGLKEQKKKHDVVLEQYRDFLKTRHKDNTRAVQELHGYFNKLLPLVLVAIEVPEYAKHAVGKDMIDLCMEIRKENEDVYKIGIDKERELLIELEKKIGLQSGILQYLTVNEFEIFLENGKLPEELEKRKTFILVQESSGGEEVFDDVDLLKQFGLKEKTQKKVLELKGMTAFKGYVKGCVRLIKTVKDADKIRDGEILVTSMTDPRYVPAIRKAVAIVTDEGGITCHAAIVSRELKKPCIIGTKIATQVLHDRDLVEVDAEKGVVRILEQARK